KNSTASPMTAGPGSCCRLTEDEAETLAQILGAPRIAERSADLTREVPGLEAGQVEIRPESPFVDLPLGDTRARTRTGASIVAIGDEACSRQSSSLRSACRSTRRTYCPWCPQPSRWPPSPAQPRLPPESSRRAVNEWRG